MKVRNGFVSNSSSSSFVVSKNDHANVFKLAEAMLVCRGDSELAIKEINRSERDHNTPIAFESTVGPAKQRRIRSSSALAAATGEREAPSACLDTLANGRPARPPPMAASGLSSLRTIVLLI